jgi:tripartite-type tricarboxylate transporter receptor subunit TctC
MKSTRPLRHRRALLSCIAGAFLMAGITSVQAADAWPSKPITLIVPFAPGGTTDIVGRIVGQKLGEALHQAVIVENRAGAGGTVGASAAARAAPDGYTFLLATVAHTMAPGIYKTLPYDFSKELDPVGLVALTPNVLIVNQSIPVKTVAELVTYIKAHPGTVNFGSAGNGSTEHLSGELFRSMTGTAITHIPYKGGAPMMTDLMGGQIQMAIETSPSAAPYIRGGKVKALAVTTMKRSAAYPGVPTLDESGIKGFDVTTWYALMAPHGTPAATVQRVNAELEKVLKQPEVQKRFEEQGLTAGEMSPVQLSGFIKNETTKWGGVEKQAGLVPQ